MTGETQTQFEQNLLSQISPAGPYPVQPMSSGVKIWLGLWAAIALLFGVLAGLLIYGLVSTYWEGVAAPLGLAGGLLVAIGLWPALFAVLALAVELLEFLKLVLTSALGIILTGTAFAGIMFVAVKALVFFA